MTGMTRLAVLIAAVALAACGEEPVQNYAPIEPQIEHPDPITERYVTCEDCTFELITINDMPCIKWTEKHGGGHSSHTYSGLSCDWSER